MEGYSVLACTITKMSFPNLVALIYQCVQPSGILRTRKDLLVPPLAKHRGEPSTY
jgi:hypothetical protein